MRRISTICAFRGSWRRRVSCQRSRKRRAAGGTVLKFYPWLALPLQQQFATQNNAGTARTCHLTARDLLTKRARPAAARFLSPVLSLRLAGSTMKTSRPQASLAGCPSPGEPFQSVGADGVLVATRLPAYI